MEFAVRSTLEWRHDGNDWVLFHQQKGGRWRPMGKVSPDPDCPGMFRSPTSRGRLSDRANLTWAKNAVFEDTLRDLIWAHRDQSRRRTPPNP
jgi:hypothetical protein